jgi:hypothetical protein
MINPSLDQAILEQLHHLAFEQQRQVLDFTRALASTRIHGVPGQALLRFAGAIDAGDLTTMAQTIEEGCEKVNLDEW